MEVVDWDIYATCYDDTRHLIGRPDLAQKHYEMIGAGQERDNAFDPVLIACTQSDCPGEELAREWLMSHPQASQLVRSRRSLVQKVLNDPVLFGLLPANSDYLVGPAVDEALFALYLDRTSRSVDDLVRSIAERVTEDLLGDVASTPALGQQPTVISRVIDTVSVVGQADALNRPVVQRQTAIRRSSLREFLLQVDGWCMLGEQTALVVMGTCYDPDEQVRSLYLISESQRLDVTSQLIRFRRQGQSLVSGPDANTEADQRHAAGFVLIVKPQLLKDRGVSALCATNLAGIETRVALATDTGLRDLSSDDLMVAWRACHRTLFELTEGDLSGLPTEWLDAIMPQQPCTHNPLQLQIDSLLAFGSRFLLSATVRDPQWHLKSLYLRQNTEVLLNLQPWCVRSLGRSDEHGPKELLLVNLPATRFGATGLQVLGLLDDGQWLRVDAVAQPATAPDVLGQLERCCEPLHGFALDAVFKAVVDPIAKSLFAPPDFRNPAYRIQTLGKYNAGRSKPAVSALLQADTLDDSLLALVSRLDSQQADDQTIEVLLDLRTPPAHAALQRFLEQLRWFRLNVQVFTSPAAKGFGRIANELARFATGDTLLVLSGQVLPQGRNWLRPLLNQLGGDIFTVFPLFINAGGSLADAGRAFARTGSDGGWVPSNRMQALPVAAIDRAHHYDVPFGLLHLALLRRTVFEGLNGFDDSVPDIELCSLAWCMKLWENDRRSVVDPNILVCLLDSSDSIPPDSALSVRHELASRYRMRLLNERWGGVIAQRFADWAAPMRSTPKGEEQ